MAENTRDKLIATSIQLMSVKGFNNTGIAEILTLADVPKGSFYHYFKSKDDLGFAIIEHYGQALRSLIGDSLAAADGSALERLRGFFESLVDYFEVDFGRCNCLLGNLAQELSAQNPQMRDAIFRHYRRVEDLIAESFALAKSEGELAAGADEQRLAKLLFSGWEGGLVRARLEQSAVPLRELLDMYFGVVFKRAA